MVTNVWIWIAFVAFVLAMLALDLGLLGRASREATTRTAALWTAVWVALALAFAAGLWILRGRPTAVTFLAGYVIEESLSADNIFVFVLIFQYFAVPRAYQHRVLFYGILGALITRGIFIGLGALALSRFEWVTYVFGGILLVTAVRMGLRRGSDFDAEHNGFVRVVRRILPVTPGYHGQRFFVREGGRWLATPLLVVVLLVEFTDLVFAVDSIPAIFGVSRDPFIVFTSNIFAVLGVRSLFVVLASVVDRFHLLTYGLAIVLGFVGVKMLAEPFGLHVDIGPSLLVILFVLGAAITASLVWPRREPAIRPPSP